MPLIVSFFYTPIGWLEVRHDELFIYQSTFTLGLQNEQVPRNELAKTIQTELNQYFTNPTHRFKLPLKPQGSTFQLNVCNALLEIPAGQTMTYGELAFKLQNSPRAIGQACKRNPLPLFIPCHRVIGKKNIGGYMGHSNFIHYKTQLLELELIKRCS